MKKVFKGRNGEEYKINVSDTDFHYVYESFGLYTCSSRSPENYGCFDV